MKKDDNIRPRVPALGRRELLRAGAGVAMTSLLNVPKAAAEEAAARPAGVLAETGTGWKNNANRASGNGPMDDTTRLLVKYTSSFSESNLTEPALESLGYTMVDSIASLLAGFESEPARICARIARTTRSDLKSTVLGYGITTTPDLAAFATTISVPAGIRATSFRASSRSPKRCTPPARKRWPRSLWAMKSSAPWPLPVRAMASATADGMVPTKAWPRHWPWES
jgi:hypothetical protein